jgi:hypothetical protein
MRLVYTHAERIEKFSGRKTKFLSPKLIAEMLNPGMADDSGEK